MSNNRKIFGIIAVIVAIIIIIVIIIFAFPGQRQAPQEIEPSDETEVSGQLPTEPQTNTTTPGDKPRNYQQYDISQEPEHEINEKDLSKMAMAFSERFGSYSNQSNYGNFTDLKIFMTESMKTWAENYVEELKENASDNSQYFGVSTKALSAEVLEFSETRGEAVIEVSTQRRETGINADTDSYVQDIKITLSKVNGQWLVDKAYWQ